MNNRTRDVGTWFCWKHVLLWAFFFSKLLVSCGARLLHFKQSLHQPTIRRKSHSHVSNLQSTNHSVKCRALHRDTKSNLNWEISYQDVDHARVEWRRCVHKEKACMYGMYSGIYDIRLFLALMKWTSMFTKHLIIKERKKIYKST